MEELKKAEMEIEAKKEKEEDKTEKVPNVAPKKRKKNWLSFVR